MLPTPVQLSLTIIELARSGRFDEIHERFAAPLRPMITADALRTGWTSASDRLGAIVSVGAPVGESTPGVTLVKVLIEYEGGPWLSWSR